MGIVAEDIARVRDATDFVALASEHLQLRKVGTQWTGLCPFHTEKTPSFYLNAELGLYHCWGCDARGDVITFVRELENLDFVGAVERLAARASITLHYDNAETGRERQRVLRVYETLEKAVAWYHDQLRSSRNGGAGAARHYVLKERGLTPEIVRHYQLGWAPDAWETLPKALRVSRADLIEAGLGSENDRGRYSDFFRGRLLFPIFEPGGRPIGAGGRMLPGGRPPKYKNTTKTAAYDKSRVVYGLNWARDVAVRKDRIVMCEGYTDVIGLHQAGVGEAVATCGTALADGHIRLLTKFAKRIVLAYDADAAGQAAAERFYEWEQRYDVDIRVAALPSGKDPAEAAAADPEALKAAIENARPFLAFQLERLWARAEMSTAEGRVRAASEAMGLVNAHPQDLVRDQYVMEVADRCRIEPNRLRGLAHVTGGPGGDERGPRTVGGQVRTGEERRGDYGAPPREREGWQGHDDGRPYDRPYEGDSYESEESAGSRQAAVHVRIPRLEAAGLAVMIHQRQAVEPRLAGVLFSSSVARLAFELLSSQGSIHAAIDEAPETVAGLLSRLAVNNPELQADDVVVRLLEEAAARAMRELNMECRAAPTTEQAGYAPAIMWLKWAREALRTPDGVAIGPEVDPDLTVERELVDWLVSDEAARTEAEGQAAPRVMEPVVGEGR